MFDFFFSVGRKLLSFLSKRKGEFLSEKTLIVRRYFIWQLASFSLLVFEFHESMAQQQTLAAFLGLNKEKDRKRKGRDGTEEENEKKTTERI